MYTRYRPAKKQTSSISIDSGFTKSGILIAILILFFLAMSFKFQRAHAFADSSKVNSGLKGYCMDDHFNLLKNGNTVDNWKCNSTEAQVWEVNITSVTHDGFCLSVKDNETAINSPIEIDKCNQEPGQVWVKDSSGFINPNSGLCLSASQANPTDQLYLAACSQLNSSQETWKSSSQSSNTSSFNCSGNEKYMIACSAVNQWIAWQSNSQGHEALLNKYSDGSPYEEWCADFVSYVFKQAGYPFTGGETDGWDENIASNVQYQAKFNIHMADSGYVPQTGDVGFFSYSGGHVEIVVSGGKTPTFIYGNSGTIDPTTGNGEMETNTITSDGSLGQIVYYLTPN